jgi:hypothetical protein
MNAHESVTPAPTLLRILAVLVCALFLLNAVAYSGHLHVPATTHMATAESHGMSCGLCTAFGGLIDAPSETEIPRPAPAAKTAVVLPDSSAPTRRLRLVAQPRGPPTSQPDVELRFT